MWQKIEQYPRVVIGIITACLIAIVLMIGGYFFNWGWTGFNGYNKISTTVQVTSSPQIITRTEEYQPGKTLWDWFQLSGVIAIPIVVGAATLWFTSQQNQTSSAIAENQQREAALQAYLDKMSELLLEKKLRRSKPEDEVRKVARARTLTVLRRLDAERKGSVLQFLHESDLLRIIDLREADLSKANLRGRYLGGANLSFAHLEGADLSFAYMNKTILAGANLSEANLYFANLSEAYLREAIVTPEQLAKAKSLQGAIMPDGSKHS